MVPRRAPSRCCRERQQCRGLSHAACRGVRLCCPAWARQGPVLLLFAVLLYEYIVQGALPSPGVRMAAGPAQQLRGCTHRICSDERTHMVFCVLVCVITSAARRSLSAQFWRRRPVVLRCSAFADDGFFYTESPSNGLCLQPVNMPLAITVCHRMEHAVCKLWTCLSSICLD